MSDHPASESLSAGPVPAAAAAIFGDNLSRAIAYHDSLVTAGPIRGLNGPREVPVLWERHIVNSALVGYLAPEILPIGAAVCDVGSGAGLPGIPLALARPDLDITLLEPLERRTAYLIEIVAELEISNVRVVRGRAGPGGDPLPGDFSLVTSRAVAPLQKLVELCLPLVSSTGWIGAMKGRRVYDEIAELRPATRDRVRGLEVVTTTSPDGAHVATVVVAQRAMRPGRRAHRT